MKNKDLFSVFMNLSYHEGIRQQRLQDIKLTDSTILRRTYLGNTVHYLLDGSSLFIPWLWCDLFSGFYNHSGNEILFNEDSSSSKDYFESFIELSTKIQLYTIGTYSKVNGVEYLDLLGDLCTLGTKKFRLWIENEFDLLLEPFEYRSIKRELEI